MASLTELKETLGFTVNIGISTNRLLAKMAGDFKKPDLVHTLFPEEVPGKLWNLPVEHLLFAGKSTCKRLKGLGIYTIGDLAQADSGMLFAHMKKHGLALQEYARGHESAGMFDMDAENKGCGNSVTTPEDLNLRFGGGDGGLRFGERGLRGESSAMRFLLKKM